MNKTTSIQVMFLEYLATEETSPKSTTFSDQLIHTQTLPKPFADDLRDFLLEINKEGLLPRGGVYTTRMVKFIDEQGKDTIVKTNVSLDNLKLKMKRYNGGD